VTNGAQGTVRGGFVTFPAGTYAADPDGAFTVQLSAGTLTSVKTPKLVGSSYQSPFYDRGYQRWLPVARAAVYPDGSRYAYASGQPSPRVHIVDVVTGRETAFAEAHPYYAQVFDFSTGGVYLAGIGEAGETGVWLVNPASGAERQVSADKIVVAVYGGKAWLSDSPTGAQNPDRLVELDLTTGAKTVWFSRPGRTVSLDGLTDDGLPVISVSDAGAYLLRSPSARDQIYSGGNWFANVSSDVHGVWMNSFDGLYLYTPGKSLHMVVADDLGFAPAGSCV
jgi:hypothetical protein